ncbi:hypothetical protein K1719_020935 [Acacia pycnantha]|nr:hypothetical protein K1719_020935 [Acacia pycnantha]
MMEGENISRLNRISSLPDSMLLHILSFLPTKQAVTTSLPSAIFNWSTIRVLKLNGISVRGVSTVNLPSLKVLHLFRSKFLDLNFVEILLSGCPLLEILVLRRLGINLRDVIPNDIGKLKHLIRADIPPFSMPLTNAFSSVTSLFLNV